MPAQLLGDLFLNGYAGAPSGSVRFYQPGTLTPVTAWSNDAATAAITQPVALDALGRSTVPVYLTAPARMIVQSAAGATLLDIERVDGLRAETTALVNTLWPAETSVNAMATALATSLGGTDGTFKFSGTGSSQRSVQTKLSESISVKDFGAKGDGITDDTNAITSAIAFAASVSGGTLKFPAGTYLISSALGVSAQSNIAFVGDGASASIIKNTSSSGNAFTLNNSSNISFNNIGITASSVSTGIAISMIGAGTVTNILFNGCAVTNHRTGVSCTGSGGVIGLVANALQITTDTNAAAIAMALTAANCSQVFLYGCPLFASTGIAVSLGAVGDTTLFGCRMLGLTGISTAGSDFAIYGGDSGGTALLTNVFLITGGTPKVTVMSPSLGTAVPANTIKSVVLSSAAGAYGDSGPYLTTNVAITGAYNVVVASYKYHRVVGTAGGITITVTAPNANTAYQGSCHTVVMANNSGGAVTWAFSVAYRVAAVAPATGNQVAVTFLCIDSVTPVFVEISRGSVVAI